MTPCSSAQLPCHRVVLPFYTIVTLEEPARAGELRSSIASKRREIRQSLCERILHFCRDTCGNVSNITKPPSSTHHQNIANASPIHRQHITKLSPTHRQNITKQTSPLYLLNLCFRLQQTSSRLRRTCPLSV